MKHFLTRNEIYFLQQFPKDQYHHIKQHHFQNTPKNNFKFQFKTKLNFKNLIYFIHNSFLINLLQIKHHHKEHYYQDL